MLRNRVWKGTIGVPAEIAIAQTVDAAKADYDAFLTSAVAGALGMFWDDKDQLAVASGDATLPENQQKKIFYAWKQADGVPHRSTGLPISGMEINTVAYAAGTAQVWTVTVGGTVAVGQIIHIGIMDTTSTEIPYPRWDYQATVTTTVAAALTDIAAQITAEKNEPRFTASASTTVLTITAADPKGVVANNYAFSTTLKPFATIEVTAAQPTDASAIVIANTVKGIASVGTLSDVKWFESFYLVQQGSPLYTADGTYNLAELGLPASNAVSGINYGYAIIKTKKLERGETRNYQDRAYFIMAIPTGSLATISNILVPPVIP